MNALNFVAATIGVMLIALAGIVVATPASLLIRPVTATDIANITTNLTTEEAIAKSNNNTHLSLGNLFYSAKSLEETYIPINETYGVVSYVYNVKLMPPNATTGTVINATERGNFSVNTLPNGLSINQGQGLITTDGGGKEETATATFYEILKMNPTTDGYGKGLVMAVIDTNSTGTLAPLNGTIVAGVTDFQSNDLNTVTLWESGIGSNASSAYSTQ